MCIIPLALSIVTLDLHIYPRGGQNAWILLPLSAMYSRINPSLDFTNTGTFHLSHPLPPLRFFLIRSLSLQFKTTDTAAFEALISQATAFHSVEVCISHQATCVLDAFFTMSLCSSSSKRTVRWLRCKSSDFGLNKYLFAGGGSRSRPGRRRLETAIYSPSGV